jgi:hypothetical protein
MWTPRYIHKIVCQLATLHQQLNRSLNFYKIRFKNLLHNREFRKNWLHYLRA